MSGPTMLVVGAVILGIAAIQWTVRGHWDPVDGVQSWLGNRAMVTVRTITAAVLAIMGSIGIVWGVIKLF